jgi:hypothetical protein
VNKRTFDAVVIVSALTFILLGAIKLDAQRNVQNGTGGPFGTLSQAAATIL